MARAANAGVPGQTRLATGLLSAGLHRRACGSIAAMPLAGPPVRRPDRIRQPESTPPGAHATQPCPNHAPASTSEWPYPLRSGCRYAFAHSAHPAQPDDRATRLAGFFTNPIRRGEENLIGSWTYARFKVFRAASFACRGAWLVHADTGCTPLAA